MKQLRILVLLCLFASALSTNLPAQIAPASAPVAGSPAAQSTEPSHTTILEYSPPPDQVAKAKQYSHARYNLFFSNTFYGLLILVILLRWRVAPAIRNLAERVSTRRSVQLLIFAPLTLLSVAIPGLATDVNDESLSRVFGLSVQTWGSWFRDWAVNQVIMLIVGTVLVAILYWVIRRSPTRWWFYFWLASIPILLAMFFIQPVVVDPLFYTFKPLEGAQPVLLSEMQKVVHRGGMDIPADRMFVMNASSKQTGLNAYVTGFGASKRVVVWDNTIAKATVPETLFVFGHEMGHYVLLHIPKETAIDATIILVLLYLAYRVSNGMLARWGAQWGIRDLQDWASLPALLFLLTVLSFIATPLTP
jgi:STE24 endopeptidase